MGQNPGLGTQTWQVNGWLFPKIWQERGLTHPHLWKDIGIRSTYCLVAFSQPLGWWFECSCRSTGFPPTHVATGCWMRRAAWCPSSYVCSFLALRSVGFIPAWTTEGQGCSDRLETAAKISRDYQLGQLLQCEIAENLKVKTIPIGSMVLEYLPTFTPYLWPSFVGFYIPAPWIRHGIWHKMHGLFREHWIGFRGILRETYDVFLVPKNRWSFL